MTVSKRTTLTLDDDVAAKLDAEARRSGRSFKETVNSCLRRALTEARRRPEAKPFKIEARDMGLRPGLDVDNVEELLDQVDGPQRR
jgi:plasmid stability protein